MAIFQDARTVQTHMRKVFGSAFPALKGLTPTPILAIKRIYSIDKELCELEWVWLTDTLMFTYEGDGKYKIEPRSSFTKIEVAPPGTKGLISYQTVEVIDYSKLVFKTKPEDGVFSVD